MLSQSITNSKTPGEYPKNSLKTVEQSRSNKCILHYFAVLWGETVRLGCKISSNSISLTFNSCGCHQVANNEVDQMRKKSDDDEPPGEMDPLTRFEKSWATWQVLLVLLVLNIEMFVSADMTR